MTTKIPTPDEIISYGSNSSSLVLYGSRDSPTLSLLCAGFAESHASFQPFAKDLSRKGIFAGVMNIPKLEKQKEALLRRGKMDERVFDEVCQCVRDAARALKNASGNDHAELIGIYHNWGVDLGSKWTSRIEQHCLKGVMDSIQTARNGIDVD
jgi:hypothetical protein